MKKVTLSFAQVAILAAIAINAAPFEETDTDILTDLGAKLTIPETVTVELSEAEIKQLLIVVPNYEFEIRQSLENATGEPVAEPETPNKPADSGAQDPA